MKKPKKPKTQRTRLGYVPTEEAIDNFKYLLREMQKATRGKLLAGRDVERLARDTIRSWVKTLRLIERIMERTYNESSRMLDDLVRISNWCAQDLAENAFVGDASGNYEKTLHGLCGICKPHVARALAHNRTADGGAQ